MASFNPTQIFEDGTTEEKGENARLSAFVGAIAVGDLGNLNPSIKLPKCNLLNEHLSSQINSRTKGYGQDPSERKYR